MIIRSQFPLPLAFVSLMLTEDSHNIFFWILLLYSSHSWIFLWVFMNLNWHSYYIHHFHGGSLKPSLWTIQRWIRQSVIKGHENYFIPIPEFLGYYHMARVLVRVADWFFLWLYYYILFQTGMSKYENNLGTSFFS